MRELRLEGWEGCGRQCIPAELERSVNEEPGGVVRRESSILSGKGNSARNSQHNSIFARTVVTSVSREDRNHSYLALFSF